MWETVRASINLYKRKFIHILGISFAISLVSSAVSSVIPIVGFVATWFFGSLASVFFLQESSRRTLSVSDLITVGEKHFVRLLGAGALVALKLLLWALIPVAGVFIVIYKSYCYIFTAEIAYSNPSMPLTQCVEQSIRTVRGRKMHIFLTDLALCAVLFAAAIPFIVALVLVFVTEGLTILLLTPAAMLFSAATAILSPVRGLYKAAYFIDCEMMTGFGVLDEGSGGVNGDYVYSDGAQEK
jgi:uncharacterized membrane protein